MKNYYFTFGQSHFTEDGIEMKDYWVRVISESYKEARDIFCIEFSIKRMNGISKWAFQYDQEDFRPELYPKGEFCCIK